jgi:light-regulated signal transduction histidine kinase (bacteriophytochrome)
MPKSLANRVKIYKFHADGSGQVVAESIKDNKLPSLLGLNFPASDIPDEAREMFVKARTRSIVNVETKQISQSIELDSETEQSLSNNIYYRNLDPCHAEYLKAMGVTSSLVISILDRESLWGLLVVHHAESRLFSEEELDTIQLVNDHLARAIAQDNLLTQAREKAHREELVNRISSLLHSESTIRLQKALEELTVALDGSGARLFLDIAEDVLGFPSGMLVKIQDYCFGEIYAEHYSKGKIHLITDINRAPIQDCHRAVLELFQVKAHLVVPIMAKDVLWGLLCVHQCTHPRRWEETEITFVIRIAAQLSLALEHSQLLAQTQKPQVVETVSTKTCQQILEHLVSTNQEIQGTALVSDQGLPIAAIFTESLDEEEISAISVDMLSLAEQIGFELDRGNLTYICVKGDKGYAFIAKCDQNLVLLILTSLSVQQGLIVLELNRLVQELKNTLNF